MNKKLISLAIRYNFYLLVAAMFTTYSFMRDVSQAFYTPEGMVPHTINSVSFTLFQMRIDVMNNGSSFVYKIFNYPLITISIAIIVNIYMLFKINRIKDNAQPS